MKELHLTMQVRNNCLRERRVALGLTAAALCRRVGVDQNTYSRLERLKGTPIDRRSGASQWTPAARKLAAFFKVQPGDLFPAGVLLVEKPVVERTFDAAEAFSVLSEETVRAALPPGQGMENTEVYAEIEKAMVCLTARETRVLKMRFGFDESEPKTLLECGQELGRSRERIRAIQYAALKKLRRRLNGLQRSAP